MWRPFALVACVALAVPALGRTRAVPHPSNLRAPASLLWIAAHPDDEAVAAPLLAAWCRDAGTRCTMIIMTRGEAGPCLRPDGCAPDLGTVRGAEAAAAAQLFGAELILLAFPDGGGTLPPSWDPRAENGSATVSTLRALIEAIHPDRVLTFDPRHGSSCHPDHRAVGEAVLEAVAQLPSPPQVDFLETRVRYSSNPLAVHFAPAFPGAQRFDALSGWGAILDDMRLHSSQFDATWIAAIESVPFAQRAVYLEPMASALVQPVEPCR